jgi:hypothetical protein
MPLPSLRSGQALGSSRRPPKATRTLLIQRGRYNHSNSSNLQTFTRVRVTQCWSLLGFMLDFAVLYSLKCQGLLLPSCSFEVSFVATSLGVIHATEEENRCLRRSRGLQPVGGTGQKSRWRLRRSPSALGSPELDPDDRSPHRRRDNRRTGEEFVDRLSPTGKMSAAGVVPCCER